uniref:Uncharacterized protein n=1 Tax=Alexandrium monilatum TaxID=311494 RepID=A0A7S4SY22_9DINO
MSTWHLAALWLIADLAPACAWRPWDGATAGFSAGLCATPGCGGSYNKSYNVQACENIGYRLVGSEVQEPTVLPWPFGQGPQPALNECSNPGELRRDLCHNILRFASIWQPEVDGRTFSGQGDKTLLQGFGHAFTKVADGLPCGYCAAVRAKRVLTDGGYNYMLIMRVDVTDDISPEVDEVTAEFGAGVVRFPEADRIPYEYKIVSCETGKADDGRSSSPPAPSPSSTPLPTPLPTPMPTPQAAPTPSPTPRPAAVPTTPAPQTAPTPSPTLTPSATPTTPAPLSTPAASPTPNPTVAPVTPPQPAPTPALEGACVTEDDCSKNSQCKVNWDVYCGSLASTCPAPFCKRVPSAPQCVTEGDCSKNPRCDVSWDAYCAALASSCPAPYCRMAAPSLASRRALVIASPRRLRSAQRHVQPGLGSSFIQRGDEVRKGDGAMGAGSDGDAEPLHAAFPTNMSRREL